MTARSILDPRFQIPGQWSSPLPYSEIEAMLAVPVTLRRFFFETCAFCGCERDNFHRCAAVSVDPVNDDRRGGRAVSAEQIRGAM
jgi:hypothetical protein